MKQRLSGEVDMMMFVFSLARSSFEMPCVRFATKPFVGAGCRQRVIVAAVSLFSIGRGACIGSNNGLGRNAGRTVNQWLTRMHEASRQRAYTGTLVVSTGSAMSASRVWHVCDGKQQMERIETLTGAPRTTIRHNSDVITFAPR